MPRRRALETRKIERQRQRLRRLILWLVLPLIIALGGFYVIPAIAPLALTVALSGLELAIAFLQAYVFTVLSCIYLQEALHLH